MPRITVLIPTHEHAATLPFAVASVQAQDVDDIEILILGDGVDDVMRATVGQLQSNDARIRFFDLPKGEGRGELHRDMVLHQAKGRIVCYQCDDDLWLPGHLAAMEAALDDADFVGAMQVNVTTEGGVRCFFFDLERPAFAEPWLAWTPNNLGPWASNGFGKAFAAHRLEAYRRLPEGWTTTPAGWPDDQFMWLKFARQPWCRMRFLQWPVSLHFPAPDRRDWAAERRAAELQRWTGIIAGRDSAVRIHRAMLADLGDRLLQQGLQDIRERADLASQREAERADFARQLEAERAMRLRAAAERADLAEQLATERGLHLQTIAARDAVLASTSWRLTAPLRTLCAALKRLGSRPR